MESNSLDRIKKREREALQSAESNTLDNSYQYLTSGIDTYDKHLFPGDTSVFNTVRVLHAAHPDRPVRVLDFGCGTNAALRDLAGRMSDIPLELVAMSVGDPRNAFEEDTDNELGITFVTIDPTSKKYSKGSFVANEGEKFDLIMSRFALQHTPDVFRVLRGLYQSLREGGELHAHVGIGTEGRRFNSRTDGLNPIGIASSQADFNATLADLKKQGIEIMRTADADHDNDSSVLVIHKTDAKMKFPHLRYRVSDSPYGRMYDRKD